MPARDAMQRAHEVLHYVGLGDERYRPCDKYSQGMKQRLKLAQALVHDPEWVFLDEPTSGLDPRGRISILELISDLAKNKGGLFSKLIKLDHPMREKDRIEIYRPLIADPKEVRKKRAAEGKALKKGGSVATEN